MTDQLVSTATSTPGRQLAWQVGVAVLVRLVINTSRRFIYPYAPTFSRSLDVPLTAITSLIAINQFTGILSPFFGPFSDRWGYRTMMLTGLSLFAIGMLAAGLLPFYGILLLALFLAGLSKSIFDPAIQAYVAAQVPYQRRGMVMGLMELSWAGASLVGIPLAGLLIDRLSWRAPFFVLGGLGLVSISMLGLLIPAEHAKLRQITRRFSFGQAWRVLSQERTAIGVLLFSLLSNMASDNLFVVYGVWLEDSFGLGVVALGAATTVIGLAELVGEGLTAAVADRLGLKRAVILGLILTALSYLMLPLIGQTLPLALTGLFAIFLTFEFTIVTNISVMTEVLPGARATMLSAAVAVSGIGRVAGALIAGPLWSWGGLMATGLTSAALSGLALAFFLWGAHHWQNRTESL
jgi:predicted MFS family arabinose efflux permease